MPRPDGQLFFFFQAEDGIRYRNVTGVQTGALPILFLAAGSVIHALAGEQDIRKMGGLWNKVPATHGVFLIGTAAIAGFPFLSGWWSKDEILGHAFTHGHYALWVLGAVAAFCTAFYMSRLLYLTFYGPSRIDEHAAHH